MVENNLLSDDQYGFRAKRSCVTQLIQVLDEWTHILDMGREVDVIYLDFQKAFDSVPHRRLLNKLYSYGFHGNVHKWIEDF